MNQISLCAHRFKVVFKSGRQFGIGPTLIRDALILHSFQVANGERMTDLKSNL